MQIQRDQEVHGLTICTGFLNLGEVDALRRVYQVHSAWTRYVYGMKDVGGASKGSGSGPLQRDMLSVLERLDFGPANMRAEVEDKSLYTILCYI
jgi:hypothetical protein